MYRGKFNLMAYLWVAL